MDTDHFLGDFYTFALFSLSYLIRTSLLSLSYLLLFPLPTEDIQPLSVAIDEDEELDNMELSDKSGKWDIIVDPIVSLVWRFHCKDRHHVDTLVSVFVVFQIESATGYGG